MSKKSKDSKETSGSFSPTIVNKKARFNYEFLEKLETGMVLVGTEVKSLRNGKANLEEAYCRIHNGELYLIGCNIPLYEHGNIMNHDPQRTRKLLVHRRQIRQLEGKLVPKGLTLVPHRIYFTHGLAKLEIVLARGKSQFDKRDKLRDRQVSRDISQEMKRRR